MSSLSQKLSNLEVAVEVPKVDLKTLTDEAGYRILSAKKTGTKYGEVILVVVKLNDDQTGAVFLPGRFTTELSEDDVRELNSSDTYFLRCTGVEGRSPDVKIWKK